MENSGLDNNEAWKPVMCDRMKALYESASKTMKFCLIVGFLKKLKRAGWIRENVKESESVADHMYRMAVLMLTLPDGNVDKIRCIKMALVHDLAESLVGDITPYDPVTKERKFEMEIESLRQIGSFLEDRQIAIEICDLFEEFEKGITEEACYVQDADKFDMILTALEYETYDADHQLDSFFNSTRNIFRTGTFQTLQKEVTSLRQTVLQKQCLQ
ncbi:5'-deoxynucleotidase HDDC2-like [Hylaeus volcanicus]|uniref:5'-deoxynucleotidase HDDC2-like n=1 Tax=Hylaeus volcanicus TaxID=313075 RepID=UPI0023B7F6C4|nr:5'-deoxynucleotidase HDDC2-like [Hylaeus volcanicus]